MPFTLTMPKLSPTMEEGTIAKWHKNIGDFVEANELLMEVATDKAIVEYNSIDSGYLRKIIIEEGGHAFVNQAIAVFTEEKNENIENYKIPEKTVQPAVTAVIEEKNIQQKAPVAQIEASSAAMQQPVFSPEPALQNYEFLLPTESAEKRIIASPLAKKIAKEKGLDLSTIKGSGPDNRIVSSDLDRAQPSGLVVFGRRECPEVPPGSFTEEAMSPLRKVIAQRLQEAKTFIPHFYIEQTIDAMPLVDLRGQLSNLNIKVSFNDLIIRGCALALRKHPNVNSGFNTANQTIIRFQTIDISVAVSVEGGLITPIIRHADYKNVGEISVEVKNLAKKAKDGKLDPQEYKGGSFTVSNLGMYGVSSFLAIINPPQAAIVSISAIEDAPVVKNGSVVPGKTLKLALSCDHRVIDGVAGAEFLRTLKTMIENPAALLI